MGSSTLRHLYLNLIGAFRANHNFTNHSIIEHYFHSDSNYDFNGTNDVFAIDIGGQRRHATQLQLENVSHSVKFLWNPLLRNTSQHPFVHVSQQSNILGKAMLVMGNHFWNFDFEDDQIQSLVADFTESHIYRSDLVVVWLTNWMPVEIDIEKRNKVEKMNKDAIAFFDLKKKKAERISQQVHYIVIDIESIMLREFGGNGLDVLKGYMMEEDGIHFQCNFMYEYPHKRISSCSSHKHHKNHKYCDDFINDLMWKEIYLHLAQK